MPLPLSIIFCARTFGLRIDIALLWQRLGLGLFMLTLHGWPKLSRYSELSKSFADPLGVGSAASLFLAVSAEVGASLLLIFGLATRLACVL